ncbi:cellulase family glycosylhydrolase [Paraflavitalea sp. CAU 1676]|uniref:cellulase family glycosylhydrolase n=1 Tax=Paraflavitalea sp. CAU 1676 TaxID=3032598 RepID=UPI0023DBD21F|nr:cellulase family glycosylhydrolase [Paraflavitalea sp. CAU 1676]MDF2187344.1 cellulase family glycosylhydrolase [Paraflavitalea sp. CAU 1676]
MRNIIALLAIIVCSLSSSAQGYLKASGKYIVNEKGEKVILRGMGLGGWMLQEGYMFKLSNIGQQYRIKAKIEEVVGKEKTAQFYEAWLANHTTKEDIDSMAAWGFNSIRLPFHYNLYTPPVEEEKVAGQQTWLNKGFEMTDALLQWCKANRMYLILDLHAAPGGQGNDLNISDRDPSKPSTWDSEANQQKTVALWRKLAERYANEPWIGGYDIINEPNWGFEDPKDVRGTAENKNAPLRKLMMDITKAIREVDNNHIIIIEGNGFGNNYRGVLPVWDNNMVLSFHKYGNFNNADAIRNFLNLREQHNVPVWLGESGENSNTWFTEAISLVETNGIGWAWWQNKKMGLRNPLEIKVPQGYQELLDYWAGKGPKPSEEQAWKTLQEFLENLKIKNNIPHPDVMDAMFRQVQTTATIPFKKHVVGKTALIQAVDFDMGRQRYAYYDKDTASYHYTPGVNTRGNRGGAYRNDGVDILSDNEGAYIHAIEDGEWTQYTITLPKAGRYNITFNVAAAADTGRIAVLIGETTAIGEIQVPNTGGEKNWQNTQPQYLYLKGTTLQIRVLATKGGFNLRNIQLSRK